MIDLHLEYIKYLQIGTPEIMSYIRKLYVALDKELTMIGDGCSAGHRNLALARTHLEDSLMHAIKAIAIQGEIKT
jgi:hypothetical protein